MLSSNTGRSSRSWRLWWWLTQHTCSQSGSHGIPTFGLYSFGMPMPCRYDMVQCTPCKVTTVPGLAKDCHPVQCLICVEHLSRVTRSRVRLGCIGSSMGWWYMAVHIQMAAGACRPCQSSTWTGGLCATSFFLHCCRQCCLRVCLLVLCTQSCVRVSTPGTSSPLKGF